MYKPEYDKAYRELHKEKIKKRREVSKNREKARKAQRAWKIKRLSQNKPLLMKFKEDHPCALCGENDPRCLEFHHVAPENKKFNISKVLNHKKWADILAEIHKCVVLCANCHSKLTYDILLLRRK